MCGFTGAARKRIKWRGELVELDTFLSDSFKMCSNKTWDINVYFEYVQTMSEWWERMWKDHSPESTKYRKIKFQVFQATQRAYCTIANDLCQKDIKNSVVLWGDGSFGPTLQGHASAPNKKLREELRHRGVQIHLANEYLTSRRTACCHQPSKYATDPKTGSKLHGLLYCKHVSSQQQCHHLVQDSCIPVHKMTEEVVKNVCSRPWSRDICSALNIYRVFMDTILKGSVPLAFGRLGEKKMSSSDKSSLDGCV
jgi:hypothetical protein